MKHNSGEKMDTTYGRLTKKKYLFGISRLFYGEGLTIGVEFKSSKLRLKYIGLMIHELETTDSWGIANINCENDMLDVTFKTTEARNSFKDKVLKDKREVSEWMKKYDALKPASSNEKKVETGKKDSS